MSKSTAKLLRQLSLAVRNVGGDNAVLLALLGEVEDHLKESLTSLDYCTLYLERKLEQACASKRGCSLSLGMTEDILSHLKQQGTQETNQECQENLGPLSI